MAILQHLYILDSEYHTNVTVGILISSIQGFKLDIDVMLMQRHSPVPNHMEQFLPLAASFMWSVDNGEPFYSEEVMEDTRYNHSCENYTYSSLSLTFVSHNCST